MQDLKNYTVGLIQAKVIDVTPFLAQRNGQWTLTRPIGNIQADTTFASEQEAYDRIAQGLVSAHGGLRVAS